MYTHTTWATLKAQLAARLHDTGEVFFVDAELDGYLKEALRTWQSLTGYWRDRGVFSTVANTAFYDINAKFPTLLGFTLKDQDVITDIEYHLQEPPTPTVWTGTAMFTLSDITDALQRRRNQFLAEVGCTINPPYTLPAPGAPISRVQLPDSTIDVRRAAWKTAGGVYTHMWRSNEYAVTTYDTSWGTSPGTPVAYSVSVTPPVSLQLAPAPINAGSVELLTIVAPAALNPAVGVLMNVPDDFCWIIKWGALADLLIKDGPAMDAHRAEYCAKRYEQAVEIVREFSCVVHGECQGIPLVVGSVYSLDAYNPEWQNATGTATDVCAAGLNLVALYPLPNGVYSVTLDVVRSAPIPATDGSFVQMGREELDAVLGYAEHLAMFKVSGPEWEATNSAWENMLAVATNFNKRLAAAASYGSAMASSSKREADMRPRRQR